MDTRVIFMGSPEFALPSLRALHLHTNLVGVVTQPDRQAGRGRKLTPPPVKKLANDLGVEVFQPKTLRTEDAYTKLRQWAPDVIVVAAFGQILRENILNLPPHGCINVHASLLPRWRGAAPINAAILHGDNETGITIMKMDPGLDTGPILTKRAIPITKIDTAGSLSEKLAQLGSKLLIETLPKYISGEISPTPQPNQESTYAPMLSKKDGELDFNQSAEFLSRKVRAFDPWPGTYTYWKGQPLKIISSLSIDQTLGIPGSRTIYEGLPAISTQDGTLVIQYLQPAGKKQMSGGVFLNGAKDWTTNT
ncbi:MAG: methionyl-tRNA formyltransferase [Anaerolineales bacterium]|jgi:methionyl-tRNA formyltransferase